jgi:hypothetical protein
MKMLDLKPYGAFIEFTIRPLIEELKQVKIIRGMDVELAIKNVISAHIKALLIEAIKTIICTAIIGFVAWKISAS